MAQINQINKINKKVTFAPNVDILGDINVNESQKNTDIDSMIDMYSLDNISKVDTFSEVPSSIINLDGYDNNDRIFEKV